MKMPCVRASSIATATWRKKDGEAKLLTLCACASGRSFVKNPFTKAWISAPPNPAVSSTSTSRRSSSSVTSLPGHHQRTRGRYFLGGNWNSFRTVVLSLLAGPELIAETPEPIAACALAAKRRSVTAPPANAVFLRKALRFCFIAEDDLTH